MSKRLAVTVSGAVSLGSYEAGVLYEVLYAIGQHNQNPQTSEEEKIYIDVLTGASAGGMSVALAAQKLLYDADALNDPYQNALYQAWVLDIDIDGLLNFQKDEPSDCSLFSSDLIENLSIRYLRSRYDGHPIAAPKTHPALSPQKTLRLGLALSNLNGIDYGRPTLTDGEFIYSRFQDEYCRTLTIEDDNEMTWAPIGEASVACGAFPFAFRAKDIQRMRAEFDDPYLSTADLGPDPLTFTYSDGGIFQNEPLGLAKNFVDDIDHHIDAGTRAYLFVSPDPKLSNTDRTFDAGMANFRKMLSKLALAILYQSRFQDWIRAEEVNTQIDLFNQRAEELRNAVANRRLTTATIEPLSAVLLQQFFSSEADLEDARQQLRTQFQAEYAGLVSTSGVGQAGADAWIDAILVLEMAADLHEKDEMYVYTVTASDQELAGAQMLAFLGFFDQDYRQHDYDIGRMKAQQWLTGSIAQQNGPLPLPRYTPQPIRPIDASLAGAKIADAPLEKRKALRDRLQNRVEIILKEANVPAIVRRPLACIYLNRKINEFLGL